MIRIITGEGVSLDLDPSAEFEVEYENPMLDDSHIPVPFSTAVTILPSASNCKILGYFPAMMLEPSVKNLAATIEVGGVPLLTGTLVYDSIEEGKLNYTFSGRDVEAEWSKKIWQLGIYKYKGADWGTMVKKVVSGEVTMVSAPLMVNPSAVAKTVYKDDAGKVELVDAEEKYMNCPLLIAGGSYASYNTSIYTSFVPVIGIDKIVQAINCLWSSIPSFSPMAVVGRYASAVQYYKVVRRTASTGKPIGDRPTYMDTYFDLGETLPDITAAEFMKNLARIRCAAIYYDGSKLKFVPFNDVVNAKVSNWDSKVSDIYTVSKESGCQYSFGYADDDSGGYSSTALTKNASDAEIAMAEGMKNVLAASGLEYTPIENEFTGDVYSGKYIKFNGNKVYLEDVVLHNMETMTSEATDEDASSFDAKSDFIPVRTVPDVLYKGTPNTSYTPIYRVAPLVPPVDANAERDSKAYIGYIFNGQMTDSGYTFSESGQEEYQGMPLTKADYQYPQHILSVKSLWDSHHKLFANWISRNRQCVSADLNLSALDVCNFRMFRLVYFRGRRWVVRKLTLTFKAGSSAIGARGEFISYDPQE